MLTQAPGRRQQQERSAPLQSGTGVLPSPPSLLVLLLLAASAAGSTAAKQGSENGSPGCVKVSFQPGSTVGRLSAGLMRRRPSKTDLLMFEP